MRHRVAASCVAVFLIIPAVAGAQASSDTVADARPPAIQPTPSPGAATFPLPPARFGAAEPRTKEPGFWAPFAAIPDDFARFFSSDTLRVAGFGGAAALASHVWDGQGIEEAAEHLPAAVFRPGNVAGGFLAQAGASVGLYSIGRLTRSPMLSGLGADLIRAQLLSQAVVQAGKFATQRSRPDGSDNYSLPSGHTASAFATATVLQQHFGWKAGLPAYGFGAYVAASRMSANKHHLSDVLLGATIGLAAGRTVTVGAGKARFAVGIAPTNGGAAITFTR